MGLVARMALWVVVSVAGGVAVTTAALLALFVTTWPKWLSLLVEPISLLLTPGVIASMLFTGHHDYLAGPTLIGNLAFYALFFLGLLLGREWIARDRRRGTRAR
jgi:hypothetical protein